MLLVFCSGKGSFPPGDFLVDKLCSSVAVIAESVLYTLCGASENL